MITGGRTSVAASGAIASTGGMAHWPVVLIVASILSLKFDWIYWWAGKLWGRGMIEVWAGQSQARRTRLRTRRALGREAGSGGLPHRVLPRCRCR